MRAQRDRRKSRPKNSGLLVVLRDILIFIAALMIFALFHHALPMRLTPAGSKSGASAAASSAAIQGAAKTGASIVILKHLAQTDL